MERLGTDRRGVVSSAVSLGGASGPHYAVLCVPQPRGGHIARLIPMVGSRVKNMGDIH